TFLNPRVSQAEIIHAAKNFRVMVLGPDELVVWFMQLMNLTQKAGLEFGTAMPNGTLRYTTNTNGGPLFVYVKDDNSFRMTPIKRRLQLYRAVAMGLWRGSHHQWCNVGYCLSALLRFGNLIGFTRVHHNPDSWEGWYWGATHQYGNSMRVGIPGFYGLVEDC